MCLENQEWFATRHPVRCQIRKLKYKVRCGRAVETDYLDGELGGAVGIGIAVEHAR